MDRLDREIQSCINLRNLIQITHLSHRSFFWKKWLFLFVYRLCLIMLFSISKRLLKIVSTIFCQVLIFSPNDSPSKIIKTAFLIAKALFVLEILKFLWFFPFLSTLFRFKRTNGSGIIYDVMNWLAYICRFILGISQKLLYYIIKLH